MRKRILKKVAQGKMSPSEAYEALYLPPSKKARYVKMHLRIKDHQVISAFVNLLFFLPIPIAWGQPIIKKYLDGEISADLMKEIRDKAGGTSVVVQSEEADVKILLF